MNNIDRLKKVFKESLPNHEVPLEQAAYGDVGWDSLAHMVLTAAIETEFNVMLEIEQIAVISSLDAAIGVLKKHGISF